MFRRLAEISAEISGYFRTEVKFHQISLQRFTNKSAAFTNKSAAFRAENPEISELTGLQAASTEMIRIVRFDKGIGTKSHKLAYVRVEEGEAHYSFADGHLATGSIAELEASSFNVDRKMLEKKICYTVFAQNAEQLRALMLSSQNIETEHVQVPARTHCSGSGFLPCLLPLTLLSPMSTPLTPPSPFVRL